MPHENGLSWKEHLFQNFPIDRSRIVDLCLTKCPVQQHHLGTSVPEPKTMEESRKTSKHHSRRNNSFSGRKDTTMRDTSLQQQQRKRSSSSCPHSNKLHSNIESTSSDAQELSITSPSPTSNSSTFPSLPQQKKSSTTKRDLSVNTDSSTLPKKKHHFVNIPYLAATNSPPTQHQTIQHSTSPYQTSSEDSNQNGKYYIFALCTTKETDIDAANSTFQSIPRYFDRGTLTLNVLSFESDVFYLRTEVLNIELPDQTEKRISKCVVDPKHQCVFIFLRSATNVHVYKWIPTTKSVKKMRNTESPLAKSNSSPSKSASADSSDSLHPPQKNASASGKLEPRRSAQTKNLAASAGGILQEILLETHPYNTLVNAAQREVPRINLDEDDSWITWVGKSMANGMIYGLTKCISPFAPKYKLDVLWISFDTSTFELDYLNVESHIRVSEVFSYENEDLEPPTLVLSNGEIVVLNLQHEEYDRKIPRLNLSLMQWNSIPYRIPHKYRRKHIENKEELKSIRRNSTSVAYIGFRYFIVLTRTRVFELFNSDWKIFSDLKELVHWKPFSDRPQMMATYRYQSIYILNRNLELFELDITYVQKLLSLHSLEHDMALALNHPRHTDMIIRLQRTKSPIPLSLRKQVLHGEQEFPLSDPPILSNDDDDDEDLVEIKVHSLVIKSRAPEVFQLAEKEGNRYVIALTDFRRSAVQHALKYIYTNKLDTSIFKLTGKELWDLYSVSQKFCLDKLKERCAVVQNRRIYQTRKDKGLPSELLKRKFNEQFRHNHLPLLSEQSPSSAHSKFKNGNSEYFSQNFDRAIRLYTETLDDSIDFVIKVLIKRCSAYEKDNQLELALADAKKAFFLCENNKKVQGKIKMRIGHIMNLMNKPMEAYICFCEAHELDPSSSDVFWDSTPLQHAGHKLKLEGHDLPEKYRYIHTQFFSELAKAFEPLINNKENSDFRFFFKNLNKTVYAHQLFVSMESGFFRRMLQHRHNQIIVVTVDDISRDATVDDVLMLLEWIYTRKSAFIYKLPSDRLCSILKLADFFDMYYIANEAQFQLLANLKQSPITEVIYYISVAHSAGLRDVYNDLFDIVSDRLKEVEDLDLSTQLSDDVSPEIVNLIATSFQCVSKNANLLKRSLSTREVQQMQLQRRSLSGDFEDPNGFLGDTDFNLTRTLLSQCPVRLFGSSYEDPLDGLVLVDGECSIWGSIWALHNLGTSEHLYKNPQDNFTIKFELTIDSFHPKYVKQGIYYVCELHRNVHSKNTHHPVFRLLVEDKMIRLQLTSNCWDFPYDGVMDNTDTQSTNSENDSSQSGDGPFLHESVTVTFNKHDRLVSCNIANRKSIEVQWPPSSYENMTAERRLFMSLSAKNERQYARYRIMEWIVSSSATTEDVSQ